MSMGRGHCALIFTVALHLFDAHRHPRPHHWAPSGYSARQRKEEVEKLNEQLRTINMSLRKSARAGTVYAPGLTYVPPPSSSDSGDLDPAGSAVAVATAAQLVPTATAVQVMLKRAV